MKRLLYHEFWSKGVFVQPRLISTSPRGKGGALNRQRVLRFLRGVLLEQKNSIRPRIHITAASQVLYTPIFATNRSAKKPDYRTDTKNTYVTTFFDLFALPKDFPGLKDISATTNPLDRAAKIETAFRDTVVCEVGCRRERFFPHIQPYEFEALLFSDTSGFVKAEPAWKAFAGKLASIRENSKSPEFINDGANTHPSARLQNLLRPGYKKWHMAPKSQPR